MNIAKLFDQAAESYDATRKKYIPCIADFYGVLIEQIPFGSRDQFSVLDLGAGTGLLTSMIRGAFPRASFVLADVSAEMLEKAKLRFQGVENIEYRIVDFESEPIPGTYDVVVSALALHHAPLDRLQGVFDKIYGCLKPRGMFLNADQILGRTREIEREYERAWLRHAKLAGCTEEEIDIAIERMKADRTSTLSDQLGALEKSGFESLNCWYQFYRYATYSGTKPA
ncbi:MAG: class I SAM-dependent methyltransferase [Verrucomicrobiales bacterium]|nr:class I SAM-dependent methyltransferase [Verrucomicrobiales bacterium]